MDQLQTSKQFSLLGLHYELLSGLTDSILRTRMLALCIEKHEQLPGTVEACNMYRLGVPCPTNRN
jgi:hypothetical protein